MHAVEASEIYAGAVLGVVGEGNAGGGGCGHRLGE
jgi:hypothetical protein